MSHQGLSGVEILQVVVIIVGIVVRPRAVVAVLTAPQLFEGMDPVTQLFYCVMC
jgi:hypothetical protein